MSVLAKNKKAFHDYETIKEFEAGIVLDGWEVKSIKTSQASLKESYVSAYKGEMWIYGMHIPRWKHACNHSEIKENRERKLLLNKKEINYLMGQEKIKSLTIVPLNIHLSHGRIKLQIALAKGKKLFDKRETIKQKDKTREIQRDLKKLGY